MAQTPSTVAQSPGRQIVAAVVTATRRFPRLYVQRFVQGFCRYLPLPVVLLLLVGLLFGSVGSTLGVEFLFFHEEPVKGFGAGFFTAMVIVWVLLVGYVLWLRDAGRHNTPPGSFAGYSGVVLVGFLLTAGAVWLAFNAISYTVLPFEQVHRGDTSARQPAATLTFHKFLFPDSEDAAPHLQIGWKEHAWFWGGAAVGLAVAVALIACGWFGWSARALAWGARRFRRFVPHAPAGTISAGEPERRARKRFELFCAVLGLVAVLLVGGGDMNPSAGWRWFLVAGGTAVGLGASWVALRRGGGPGFFVFLVAHLLAAHLVVTWLAHKTSDWRVATAGAVGGWWLGAVVGSAFAATFVYGVRHSSGERLRTLFRDHALHPQDKFRAQVYAGACTLAVAGLVLFGVFTTGIILGSWLTPACMCLFPIFVGVLGYGLLSLVVRSELTVALATVAVLFLLAGGVQRYKYQIDYAAPESVSEGDPRMDYDHPLDLTGQLKFEREQRWKLNCLAQQAYAETRPCLEWKKGTQDNVEKQYAELDKNQRLLPLKLFVPSSSSAIGVVSEFPKYKSGDVDHLLPPRELGFANKSPDAWTACPPAEPRPLVIVTVSGGALRAAAWTHAILAELELLFAEKQIDFPAHVRIIAGASGGMFGAATYVVSLPKPGCDRSDREKALREEYTNLVKDSLTPLMHQAVFGDLPNLFSPWPHRYDRGQALEEAWRKNGLTKLTAKTFADLRAGEAEGWRPSLVFSPMIVEDGRRLLFSNLDLRYAVSNDAPILRPNSPHTVQPWKEVQNLSREALEFFRMFPGERNRLPISTAVRLSASFPVLSPAAVLPTVPRRRIVDAGYYDNYGVSLASAWLFSLSHKQWIQTHASKVLLIQIRAYESETARTLGRVEDAGPLVHPEKSGLFGRATEDFTTPLIGANRARESSASFRNDEQLEQLAWYLRSEIDKDIDFKVLTLELKLSEDDYPLNWYMPQKKTQYIRCYARRLIRGGPPEECEPIQMGQEKPTEPRRQQLIEWWEKPSPGAGNRGSACGPPCP